MAMLLAVILFALSIDPGDRVVTWQFSSVSNGPKEVVITLTAQIDEGWHMYATDLPSDEGPLPTEFRFTESELYVIDGDLIESEPVEQFDPNFSVVVKHHSGSPEFKMKLNRRTTEAFTVKGEVEYMVCNDRTCLPPAVVPFSIEVEEVSQARK